MQDIELHRIVASEGVPVLSDVRDVDQASEAASRFGLRPNRILPLDRYSVLDASMQVIVSPSMSFARLIYGAPVMIIPTAPEDDSFMLGITLSGQARFQYGSSTVISGVRTCGFIPPYREFRSEMSGDYDQVVLAFDRWGFERTAARLLDASSEGPVEFDYSTDIIPLAVDLMPLLEASASMYAAEDRRLSEEGLRTLSTIVIETTLLRMPSFQARIKSRGAAHDRNVATAMEYMVAHLAQPVSLTEVAAQVHVSPRALQLAFQRQVGTSPMRWLRQRRLSYARSLLTDPGKAHLRVSDIAYASGFLHLGDFSRRFAAEYGVTPSVLRRHAAAENAGRRTDHLSPQPRQRVPEQGAATRSKADPIVRLIQPTEEAHRPLVQSGPTEPTLA